MVFFIFSVVILSYDRILPSPLTFLKSFHGNSILNVLKLLYLIY